jgi:hypothetical protein
MTENLRAMVERFVAYKKALGRKYWSETHELKLCPDPRPPADPDAAEPTPH